MKILYVVPYPPSAVRVRPYQMIRGLQKQGHEVIVATLYANEEELEDVKNLQKAGFQCVVARLSKMRILRNLIRSRFSNEPFQAHYCDQPQFWDNLAQFITQNPVDIIHVEHLRGAHAGLFLRKIAREKNLRIPIVWDSVDCISYLFEQGARHGSTLRSKLMTRVELERTKRLETRLLSEFDRTIVTSNIDREAFLNLAQAKSNQQARIEVVKNGVDLDFFSPGRLKREPETIVFTGKMSYHANVAAALYLIEEIMPRVWQEKPNAQVYIVGKDPHKIIQNRAKGNDRIVITGSVPDIRPYLWRATVSVAPVTYGAGIQNKVLEALACETPVIASSVAGAPLETVAGKEILVSNDAASFARNIIDLINDNARRVEMSSAGYEYVNRNHQWNETIKQLETIYTTVIHENHQTL